MVRGNARDVSGGSNLNGYLQTVRVLLVLRNKRNKSYKGVELPPSSCPCEISELSEIRCAPGGDSRAGRLAVYPTRLSDFLRMNSSERSQEP